MEIIVNGQPERLAENELTIQRLLELNKVESPDMVAVQYNGRVLERDQYATTTLREQDQVDFLYFMGGGAGR